MAGNHAREPIDSRDDQLEVTVVSFGALSSRKVLGPKFPAVALMEYCGARSEFDFSTPYHHPVGLSTKHSSIDLKA